LDFNIKKNPIIKKQEEKYPKRDMDIAYQFSKLMIGEFQDFCKGNSFYLVAQQEKVRKKEILTS